MRTFTRGCAALAACLWLTGCVGTADTTIAPTLVPTQEIYITISAAGDVTHGGDQRKKKDLFAAELARRDGDYGFALRNVLPIFFADDLSIVNYEGALTTRKSAVDKMFSFAGAPENVQALTLGSVEAVALSNNHVFDHGPKGYADTQQTLKNAGIVYSGEGELGIYEVQGVRIGMIAHNMLHDGYKNTQRVIPDEIRALREQGCQIVIASFHWGVEYDYWPHDRQVDMGRFTVDAGADLVLGHHPHVINPIEKYNGKYIVYSLGNFSFAGNMNPKDKDTFIFQQRFLVTQGMVWDAGMRIVPCRISSVTDRNDFVPTPYDGAEAQRVVEKLMENGKKMENPVQAYPLTWDP